MINYITEWQVGIRNLICRKLLNSDSFICWPFVEWLWETCMIHSLYPGFGLGASDGRQIKSSQVLLHVNHHVQGHDMLMCTFWSQESLIGRKYYCKLMLKSLVHDLSIKLCSGHQHYNSKQKTISFQSNVNYVLFWAHLVLWWGWIITFGERESNRGAKHVAADNKNKIKTLTFMSHKNLISYRIWYGRNDWHKYTFFWKRDSILTVSWRNSYLIRLLLLLLLLSVRLQLYAA